MPNTDIMINVAVIWGGNKYVVEIDSNASIKDLGDELQKLTCVKPDTMKLSVPQFSGKTSKLLSPFSDENSGPSLREASIVEGKSAGFYEQDKHHFTDAGDSMATEIPDENQLKTDDEPDPDDHSCDPHTYEPDPDDSQGNHSQVMGILNGQVYLSKIVDECNPNGLGHKQDKVERGVSEKVVKDAHLPFERMEEQEYLEKDYSEPDSDESHENKSEPDPDESCENKGEPDPDESCENKGEPDPDESCENEGEPDPDESRENKGKPDPDESRENVGKPDPDESLENKGKPDPDESRENNKPDEHLTSSLQAKQKPYEDMVSFQGVSCMQIDEPDPDDQELWRIQDPVTFVCERLQKSTELLRAEVNTTEAKAALQTLFKIIGNAMEHPDEVKYKRLGKLQWKSCRQLDLAKMLCSTNLGSPKLTWC